MKTISWDRFVKKIYIKAPVNQLFNLWTTQEGLKAWFLKDAQYMGPDDTLRNPDAPAEKGDSFIWYWHNCDATEKGAVLKSNGKNTFTITFADTQVKVELTETDKGTLVTLEQSQIPINETGKYQIFYGCSNGWTFWLANLKAYAEHGILLHETELDIADPEYDGYEFVNM